MWTIVGANVLLFAGLLIQGCQREPVTSEIPAGTAAETSVPETNAVAVTQTAPETNAPVAPSFVAPGTNSVTETPVATPVPAPAPAVTKPYVVAKGDSFYRIAKAHGVSMKALADANPGVDSTKLKVGQTLQLPAGTQPPTAISASTPAPAGATTSPSSNRYVVKAGDTLARIARAHGTTVRAIKAANGLNSDRIVAGHSLKIPETRSAASSRA